MLYRLKKKMKQNPLLWKYALNLKPAFSYIFKKQEINNEAKRVLEDLNKNGIAVTTFDKLLDEPEMYEKLAAAIAREEVVKSAEINATRKSLNDDQSIGKKTFMFEVLGHNPELNPDSIYIKFALQKPILQIANAYLGMLTKLRYMNVWHTFASDVKARESQLWHRDREDYYICKVFVYLSDVDEGAGPFTYAPKTHYKGAIRQEPEYHLEGTVKRTTDVQMAKIVPQNEWIKGIGKKGTIIFADTRGYHKGGECRTNDRLMYTCMFTSKSSDSPEFFVRPKEVKQQDTEEKYFAITPSR